MDKQQTMKIKGVAILMLLFHYLFYSASRIEENQMVFYLLPQQLIQNIALCARVCVWIFAFLSAFGLSRKYMMLKTPCDRRSINHFVRSHWISLMKPYWFVFVLMFLASFVIFQNPMDIYQWNPVYIFLGFFGASDFFGTPTLCGVWWYMCFAQIVLFFIPILFELCRKLGWITIVICFVLIQFAGEGIKSSYGGAYIGYLMVVLVGILCAQNNTFERIKEKMFHKWQRILLAMVLLAAIFISLYVQLMYSWGDRARLFMSLAAILISLFVYLFMTYPVLECVLKFLGKYSGIIFMVHGFAYLHYPKLIYWSHNVVLTYLTLLVVSLLLSMGIMQLQRLLHYQNWSFSRLFLKRES